MSKQYDNKGTISLWPNENYQAGGKYPRFKGSAYAHRDIKAGEQIDVAVWDGKSENPKAPVLQGTVSDKYVADGGAPAGTDAGDSVPF